MHRFYIHARIFVVNINRNILIICLHLIYPHLFGINTSRIARNKVVQLARLNHLIAECFKFKSWSSYYLYHCSVSYSLSSLFHWVMMRFVYIRWYEVTYEDHASKMIAWRVIQLAHYKLSTYCVSGWYYDLYYNILHRKYVTRRLLELIITNESKNFNRCSTADILGIIFVSYYLFPIKRHKMGA